MGCMFDFSFIESISSSILGYSDDKAAVFSLMSGLNVLTGCADSKLSCPFNFSTIFVLSLFVIILSSEVIVVHVLI